MGNYVDNKRFLEEIIKHRKTRQLALDTGATPPKLNDYIGSVILTMAENIAKKPRWNRYTWKEEMVDDAIATCITYFNTFDPEKGKLPFAYFTSVIENAFQNRCNIEELNRYTVYKNFFENGNPYDTLVQSDDTVAQFDSIIEFMNNFETRMEKKKAKKEAQKLEKEKRGVFSGKR